MPSVTIQPGATVFVTGVNGLLASHTVDQLLKRGYNVRGSVRDATKNKWVAEYFDGKYKDAKFELIEVPDMTVEGCYDKYLHGVEGFIHVAAPVGGLDTAPDVETGIAPSVNGGINALKASAKAPSVKSFVVTSSSVAAYFPRPNEEFTVTDKDYNDVALATLKDNESKKGWYMYAIMKTETEKRMWKWVEENKPSFRFNTILPNANFGTLIVPKHQGYPSTVGWAHAAWTGENLAMMASFITPQWFISNQDTAILHISALIHSDVKSERLFGFAEPWSYNDLLAIYRKHYPERKFPGDLKDVGVDRSHPPNQRAEEVLKWSKGSGWDELEKTVVEMGNQFAQA